MIKSVNIHRLIRYYKSNGLLRTLCRAFVVLIRKVWREKIVIFYVKLSEIEDESLILPNDLKIECNSKQEKISDNDMKKLSDFRVKQIVEQQIKERFDKGAVLWLAKLNNEVVGFGWSIMQVPVKPYFIPLTGKDIHLFDFEVFPDFRGRRINPTLVNYMLLDLKKAHKDRAFIETTITNKGEIRSLAKTYFRKIAIARQLNILHGNIVIWYEMLAEN